MDFKHKWLNYVPCGADIPESWEPVVIRLIQDIEDVVGYVDWFKIDQIKEKFGGLRFYYSLDSEMDVPDIVDTDRIDKLIADAEDTVWEIARKEKENDQGRNGRSLPAKKRKHPTKGDTSKPG